MTEKFNAFYRVIDPDDNATGGGAASAVAGAMAASLVSMVARLSVGKKNMPESDAYYQDVAKHAVVISGQLFEGSNADSDAFDQVMAAFRLPKTSDQEKASRSEAIQRATIGATEVPLENAGRCAEVLNLARSLEGRSNKNAASDLECAVYLAIAGLKGALSNAEINISGIIDDGEALRLRNRVKALRSALES